MSSNKTTGLDINGKSSSTRKQQWAILGLMSVLAVISVWKGSDLGVNIAGMLSLCYGSCEYKKSKEFSSQKKI